MKNYWICFWIALCAAELMMVSGRLKDIHGDLERIANHTAQAERGN